MRHDVGLVFLQNLLVELRRFVEPVVVVESDLRVCRGGPDRRSRLRHACRHLLRPLCPQGLYRHRQEFRELDRKRVAS